MQIETTKIIQEQFKTLPPVIQDTITNSNWQEKIRRVVKNNSLHVDQGAAIENLVLITMLGLENPDDFVDNAKEYAQVSEDAAYTISSEVEREIFSDIRRKLIALTETADTVADVDREANSELNKVAEDIENAVKISAKPSLKDKIPSDYFDKNKKVEAPIIAKQETGLKPITTQITAPIGALEKKPEEPKVLTAIEKEIAEIIETKKLTDIEPAAPVVKKIFAPMPKTIDILKSEDKIFVPNTTQPAKVDPYRESIE